MNADIAHAAAYRPEDRAAMTENAILNAFDCSLADIRRAYTNVVDRGDHRRIHAARLREMHKAVARVAARLANAGIR